MSLARRCVVLMPLRDQYDILYKGVLDPAICRAGYQPARGDRLYGTQPIPRKVMDAIERCDALVADISEDNPNVTYEIGIAHTLGKPVVFISHEREQAIPFYLGHQTIHFYNTDTTNWKEQLSKEITNTLASGINKLIPYVHNQNLGICGYFPQDSDEFKAALVRAIRGAERQIVFIGWGLAFALGDGSRMIIDELKDQLSRANDLHTFILLPRPEHPGLRERIREEAVAQRRAIVDNWPEVFFKFAQELSLDVPEDVKRRAIVERLSYLPTAMLLQLDDQYFFRPYGPPNVGGWKSPWIHCDIEGASPSWRTYLENSIEFAVADVRSRRMEG